ncbi:DUF1800 domain-containing protein [Aliiroseovarius sp.]|uniref:DUF1800 domain-containing protein n=1 Tax=Aliiroseovarius sp. TaxID=1872442 RepID=UPI003BAC6FD3
MRFDPDIAAIRFGTGLGPGAQLVDGPGALLASVATEGASPHRIPGFDSQLDDLRTARRLRHDKQEGKAGADEALRAHRRQMGERGLTWFAARLARHVAAPVGFAERLELFWADHFTVVGKRADARALGATFTQDAIRPHLTGRFADMLRAAVEHPMMLAYLDQFASVGEGSRAAERSGRGLNENLAREILELHTLGVGGAYDQRDVRELAKLLAGYAFSKEMQVVYRPGRGTPGAEVILGRRYGGAKPRIEDVHAALEDIAAHPDTARHLARKLAVHFISDTPDEGLVAHLAARYRDSDGDLTAVYAALLEHPAAWAPRARKARQPIEFISASLRALGVAPDEIAGADPKQIRQGALQPMALMGQRWEQPAGPDGWPEQPSYWITPQGLAARLQWAMTVPALLRPALPDPRDLARQALGSRLDAETKFAARAAQTKWEGVGLVLASPAFQMR